MGNSNQIKLYVFHYKNGKPFPVQLCYIHIWAGKNGVSVETELVGDDTGENISAKNRYYSELSGIYWAWKNQQSAIVGTSHYRRFFTAFPIPISYRIKQFLFGVIGLKRKREGLIYTSRFNFWEDKLLKCSEIEHLLIQYDAILPKRRSLKYTVEEHFSRYHQQRDLVLLKEIIEEIMPEYSSSFAKVIKGKYLYANNMFVLRKEKFDLLATWLFQVLEIFEKRVDLSQYTNYQERLFGFLSERLITTWIEHQQMNCIELPLVYFKKLKHK